MRDESWRSCQPWGKDTQGWGPVGKARPSPPFSRVTTPSPACPPATALEGPLRTEPQEYTAQVSTVISSSRKIPA